MLRIRELFVAIASGETRRASALIQTILKQAAAEELPRKFLAHTARALTTGNWSFFPEQFRRELFIGPNGSILLIAPFTRLRGAVPKTVLSALRGRVITHERFSGLEHEIKKLFGKLCQPVTHVIPINVDEAAGAFASRAGEAFLVPDGFPGLEDGNGPALNDMKEQCRRFRRAGIRNVRAIFDAESAAFLLAPLGGGQAEVAIRHAEYQLHDGGHGSGIGLLAKLRAQVLSTPFLRAVEEWRADGVGFELGARTLGADIASKLLCSNIGTRFGVDATRRGGLDRDTDVNSALLTFAFLLESAALKISRNGKLALTNPTSAGIAAAFEPMRAEAVRLTRLELELNSVCGIWRLFGTVPVSRAAERMFEKYVLQPCESRLGDLE